MTTPTPDKSPGEKLYDAVLRRRDENGESFVCGLVGWRKVEEGGAYVVFIRYLKSGGILKCLSEAEASAIAPKLIVALREHGDELTRFCRARLAEERTREAARLARTSPWSGPLRRPPTPDRTRDGVQQNTVTF